MDVKQQRDIRNARARLKAAETELTRAEAGAKIQESVDGVMTALNHYRRFRICIQWCLIIGLIPFFLLLGMLSPLGPGWYVVMTEFNYWPEFGLWTAVWFLLALLFDGVK